MVLTEVINMMIHEAAQRSGTTKKAIEYYCMKGLIHPEVTENVYRSFTEEDVLLLKKISLLRSLGVPVEDIRSLLGGDEDAVFQRIAEERGRILQKQKQQYELLQELAVSRDWDAVGRRRAVMEAQESITERLIRAFPGFYGTWLGLHFSRFLQDPIQNEAQEAAYREICAYLDGLQFELPGDLTAYLDEMNSEDAVQMFKDAEAAVTDAMEDPEEYLRTHKEEIEKYLEYTDTEEYRSSPAFRLKEAFAQFQKEQGYDTVFLPLMRRLSPSYDAYREKLEKADRTFMDAYPARLQ